jgi:AraC-like DNA-binding protein
MKPLLEKINRGFGNSFTVRSFIHSPQKKDPQWHFHPEYEIVYISNGRGKRHIANHISYYTEGDLIFLGPNLPHFGFTEKMDEGDIEIVVQMEEGFLGNTFFLLPEMTSILQLFERAKKGIIFKGEIRKKVGTLLVSLLEEDSFGKLMGLLHALQMMATTEEYEVLQVQGFSLEVNAQHLSRMETIYRYVDQNIGNDLQLEIAARKVNLSVPAFCRYFKKLTGKTFSHFVNEVRIAQAASMLKEEHLSIAEVSFSCGFNNLSYFNKQFKKITGFNPSAYRFANKKIISDYG